MKSVFSFYHSFTPPLFLCFDTEDKIAELDQKLYSSDQTGSEDEYEDVHIIDYYAVLSGVKDTILRVNAASMAIRKRHPISYFSPS